jgi:hypothetical protein
MSLKYFTQNYIADIQVNNNNNNNCNTVFPRDMVCLRNIGIDFLHKGHTEDDDDDDDDDDDNNNNNNQLSQ